MRYLRSHARLSRLARVLVAAMVAPHLMWGAPARAQRTTPSVYVLDFNNKTTVGGALLGQMAAAQVSLQLAESDNWDVVPESQVQRRIQELNLHQPFDRIDRSRIAQGGGVDARAVVYGSVQEARITGGAAPQAYVRLAVVVEDVRTHVLINGAVAEATSTARMGFSGNADILLEEALGKAAYIARDHMERFRLPEGTVLNTTVVGTPDNPDLDALINIGARGGMRRGMELIATRQGQPVGRIRITSVDADISTGRVIENAQGVRPEDRVRAIFNLSDFQQTRSGRRASMEAASRVGTRVVKDAVAPASDKVAVEEPKVTTVRPGGVLIPARTPQENLVLTQNQPQVPPPVVIDEPDVDRETGGRGRGVLGTGALRMLVGGALVLGLVSLAKGAGGSDIGGTSATGPEAYSFQYGIGAPGAFIRFCWERPSNIRIGQIQGYVIWRSDELGDFRVVGALQGGTRLCFVDSEATRTITAPSGTPGGEAGDEEEIEDVPGIQPGRQYRYQVSVVYAAGLEDRDGNGTPDGEEGIVYLSNLSTSSPWATAITPPDITAIDGDTPTNSQRVDLSDLEVTWQQTPGADEYIIWLSRNPGFRDRTALGPFKTLPVDQGGPQTVSRTINANRAGLGNARVVYITIGARASGDRMNPRPYGAIFGPRVAVRPEDAPPPPPSAGAAGKGRDNSPRSDKNKEAAPRKDGATKSGK